MPLVDAWSVKVNQQDGISMDGNTMLARPDELLWQEVHQARKLVNAILCVNYQTDIEVGELAGLSLMLNNVAQAASVAQAAIDANIAGSVIRSSSVL
jgi:hypothetical protein